MTNAELREVLGDMVLRLHEVFQVVREPLADNGVAYADILDDTTKDLLTHIDAQERELAVLRTALEFAEGAIENAIYTEDGLDGDTGKAVLDMINPLIRTPEEMKERAKEIAKWPVV